MALDQLARSWIQLREIEMVPVDVAEQDEGPPVTLRALIFAKSSNVVEP